LTSLQAYGAADDFSQFMNMEIVFKIDIYIITEALNEI
jgi:hypothetical protein